VLRGQIAAPAPMHIRTVTDRTRDIAHNVTPVMKMPCNY